MIRSTTTTLGLLLVMATFSFAQTPERSAEVRQDQVGVDAGKPVTLEPDGEAHAPSVWMQQKLKHSQKIFAAMVEGDLKGVESSTRFLSLLNRLESFVRGRSPEYRTQLALFQYANEEILQGASQQNLDRVTLGYNQMTLSCVACHRQMRMER